MAKTARDKKRVWIPRVSEERVQELAEQIKPLAQCQCGRIHYIEPVCEVFTYKPKFLNEATDLKPLCDITTYHVAGNYHFKPTIYEVLAQIPAEHLNDVVAFAIVEGPDDESLNRNEAGYYVATTRLYVRK